MLWLINFSMDFLSLYAAGKLLSLPLSPWKMGLSAAVGAVYAVAAAALGWDGIGGAAAAAAVSAAMSLLAFGIREGGRGLARTFFAVWGCGTLLGGIMTLFCGFWQSGVPQSPGADLYAASTLALLAAVRMAGRRLRRGYAHVRICRDAFYYEGNALIDSGNLLRDPLSDTPVILLRAKEARQLVGEEADTLFCGILPEQTPPAGIRAVPVRGVGGTKLLYGFLCPGVQVTFRRRTGVYRAVICVDHGAQDYGGCGVLLPESLVP